MSSGSKEGPVEPCHCISHQFLRSAVKDPSKVAVVQASGGIQICREIKEIILGGKKLAVLDQEQLINSPPVYKGDLCFTYGELLAAVECLSCRICRVLDGRGDPDLVQPKVFFVGYIHAAQGMINSIADSSGCFKRRPKIIGLHMIPSVEYIIAVLAVLRCGEAFLPLDPSWPQERLLHLATFSRAELIITCLRSSAGTWAKGGSKFSVLYFSMGSTQPKNDLFGLEWPCKSKIPRLYCYLMYTSGSTGKPKGICGTEEGLVNRFLWMQQVFPVCSDEALLFKTPVSFIDHLQEILTAILSCTSLIIPPFDDLKANPFYLVDILKLYSISRLVTVPSLARVVLPSSQRSKWIQLQSTLKLLVLSGETLSLSLWNILHGLLPETIILNLYGSTEVSGDCSFFDCSKLPKILETEVLSSVPIGSPIANCDVTLLEDDKANEGEICVSGSCLFAGYFDDIYHESFAKKSQYPCFKTGDLARCLQSGDLLFIGRKDRTVKVNGQRIALEEVEDALRGYPDVVDAAVVLERHGDAYELKHLKAHLVLRKDTETRGHMTSSMNESGGDKSLMASIKSWLAGRLPTAMLPSEYSFIDSLPMSSSGKVDYIALQNLYSISKHQVEESNRSQLIDDHLEIIKAAFCDALLLEKVEDNEDFFALGGNSVLAALLSHRLAIDMRLLYSYPTPASLVDALVDRKIVFQGKRLKVNNSLVGVHPDQSKTLVNVDDTTVSDLSVWFSWMNLPKLCSFGRCNQFICGEGDKIDEDEKNCRTIETLRNKTCDLREIWKVHLGSCVDASPLVVLKNCEILLFIGSHSRIFFCLDALSGAVRWKTNLAGRIECSAATTTDFSHVVVGCYKGKIYFIDFDSGVSSWIFQTSGEVKMQPMAWKNLVWCGSHDHWVYALDHVQQCCVYKVFCGGSPYGSPSVDLARNLIYLASTSGRVTAISGPPFRVAWLYESGAPIFGSLSLDPFSGNVICCSVDGRVFTLNSEGSVVWQAKTRGPIFAGACISPALPSQVLVCSRDGSVYSFESNGGRLLWEHCVGDLITSSAYIDEQIQLASDPLISGQRLVCICSSSGRIRLLRVEEDLQGKGNIERRPVEEFAGADLTGEVFSSPVMIAGRIFVGCRDNHIHCVKAAVSTEASSRLGDNHGAVNPSD